MPTPESLAYGLQRGFPKDQIFNITNFSGVPNYLKKKTPPSLPPPPPPMNNNMKKRMEERQEKLKEERRKANRRVFNLKFLKSLERNENEIPKEFQGLSTIPNSRKISNVSDPKISRSPSPSKGGKRKTKRSSKRKVRRSTRKH